MAEFGFLCFSLTVCALLCYKLGIMYLAPWDVSELNIVNWKVSRALGIYTCNCLFSSILGLCGLIARIIAC